MSNYKELFISQLQKHQRDSDIFKEIFKAIGNQFTSYEEFVDELANQFFIDSATWALEYYEKELGIKTDETKTFAQRRAVIKAKIRGAGKVSSLVLKFVAESFLDGVVDIGFDGEIIADITYLDFAEKILDASDMRAALFQIKPAHLGIRYIFTVVKEVIELQENIYATDIVRNTKLGLWPLGNTPFATQGEEVQVK